MSILATRPNDGEQSGGGPIRCRILEDGSHTQHRLGIVEATVPTGPHIPFPAPSASLPSLFARLLPTCMSITSVT